MIICQSNVDILRTNMRLDAECRIYKYNEDHVNHLKDVNDSLKKVYQLQCRLEKGKGRVLTYKEKIL